MFKDPEWATEEEWNAYAWFGFAVSEAQVIEMQLTILATAFAIQSQKGGDQESGWFELYDKHGRLTLGRLFRKIKRFLDAKLVIDLECVVELRNELVHEFFWPRKQSINDPDPTPEESIKKLAAIASKFRSVSSCLEPSIDEFIRKHGLDKKTVTEEAKKQICPK